MATVHDVAAYILSKTGEITAMKLQKLAYYSQAWHLVWEDRPLFQNRFEAWANGPVSPDLYREHRGTFRVASWGKGDASALDYGEADSVDVVLKSYGDFTAYQLSEMTHHELPWMEARAGTPEGARSTAEISQGAMQDFYMGASARNS